jgi:hypothetical protein
MNIDDADMGEWGALGPTWKSEEHARKAQGGAK